MAINSMYSSVVYDVSQSLKKELVFCENAEMCIKHLKVCELEILDKYKNYLGSNKLELHWFVKSKTINTVKAIIEQINNANMFPVGMIFYSYNVSFRLDFSIFLENDILKWRSPGMYINIYCQNQAYAYIHDNRFPQAKSKTIELHKKDLNASFIKAVRTFNNIETRNFL